MMLPHLAILVLLCYKYISIYMYISYVLGFHAKCKTKGYITYSSSSAAGPKMVKRQPSHLDVSSALQHSHGCRH